MTYSPNSAVKSLTGKVQLFFDHANDLILLLSISESDAGRYRLGLYDENSQLTYTKSGRILGDESSGSPNRALGGFSDPLTGESLILEKTTSRFDTLSEEDLVGVYTSTSLRFLPYLFGTYANYYILPMPEAVFDWLRKYASARKSLQDLTNNPEEKISSKDLTSVIGSMISYPYSASNRGFDASTKSYDLLKLVGGIESDSGSIRLGKEDLVGILKNQDKSSARTEKLTITGNSAANLLIGDRDDNYLKGRGGSDVLIGGLGRDELTGGTGGDHFVFSSLFDSARSRKTCDVVTDFQGHLGDRIDLSKIDAYASQAGNQVFTYIDSSQGFSGLKGEITFKGGMLLINTDKNTNVDMRISLLGVQEFDESFLIL